MIRTIGRVAIVACLGLATVVYGALEKHVTVRIEGRPVAVVSHASTVGDALRRAGVDLGPRDRVTPSPETPLREGATIDVRWGKPVTVLLNGKPRKVIVTALTVDELLDELNLRDTVLDAVRPARAAAVRAGMTVRYRRAVGITVRHDGETERVVTNARSVGAVVRELGITLGDLDVLRPKPKTFPEQGMKIRIERVRLKEVTQTEPVPYRTILRRTEGMEYGSRKLVQAGREGVRRVRLEVRLVDDERVSKKVIGSTVVQEPRSRIIAIGSGFPGCTCRRGSDTGEATWYGEADGLSAAHRTLPMGTVVRVENLANDKSVNVVIRDRGPFGEGRIIDLSDEAFGRIASLSAGVISVRIRW